jgi:hypothetical protein
MRFNLIIINGRDFVLCADPFHGPAVGTPITRSAEAQGSRGRPS